MVRLPDPPLGAPCTFITQKGPVSKDTIRESLGQDDRKKENIRLVYSTKHCLTQKNQGKNSKSTIRNNRCSIEHFLKGVIHKKFCPEHGVHLKGIEPRKVIFPSIILAPFQAWEEGKVEFHMLQSFKWLPPSWMSCLEESAWKILWLSASSWKDSEKYRVGVGSIKGGAAKKGGKSWKSPSESKENESWKAAWPYMRSRFIRLKSITKPNNIQKKTVW